MPSIAIVERCSSASAVGTMLTTIHVITTFSGGEPGESPVVFVVAFCCWVVALRAVSMDSDTKCKFELVKHLLAHKGRFAKRARRRGPAAQSGTFTCLEWGLYTVLRRGVHAHEG
jgi:hypothetical protein